MLSAGNLINSSHASPRIWERAEWIIHCESVPYKFSLLLLPDKWLRAGPISSHLFVYLSATEEPNCHFLKRQTDHKPCEEPFGSSTPFSSTLRKNRVRRDLQRWLCSLVTSPLTPGALGGFQPRCGDDTAGIPWPPAGRRARHGRAGCTSNSSVRGTAAPHCSPNAGQAASPALCPVTLTLGNGVAYWKLGERVWKRPECCFKQRDSKAPARAAAEQPSLSSQPPEGASLQQPLPCLTCAQQLTSKKTSHCTYADSKYPAFIQFIFFLWKNIWITKNAITVADAHDISCIAYWKLFPVT